MFTLFILQMLTGYGVDDEVTRILDTYDFYIIPIVNPDGYIRSTVNTSSSPWEVTKPEMDAFDRQGLLMLINVVIIILILGI